MKKQSFSLKLLSGVFYGQSFIKTVRVPLYKVQLFPHFRTFDKSTFSYTGIADWNSLPEYLKAIEKLQRLKVVSKNYLGVTCILKLSNVTFSFI